MSRVLVTGMSGTGKSSALAELGRRGYRVVDTDDPGWREYREYVESSDEVRRGEWLWVEERITGLKAAAKRRRARCGAYGWISFLRIVGRSGPTV
jgi:predicted ATPase